MERKRIVSMTEIKKKFKTVSDIYNFCRENNLYFPRLPGFTTDFFLLFLQGRKSLLPMGFSNGYSFAYYTKEKLFTKNYLWNIIKAKADLLSFFPDQIPLESLDRNYMFSVIAFKDQQCWLAMYNEYKKKEANVASTKWDYYGVELSESMFNSIDKFISSSDKGSGKNFRTTKKGNPNDSMFRLNMGNDNAGNAPIGPQNQRMDDGNENMGGA